MVVAPVADAEEENTTNQPTPSQVEVCTPNQNQEEGEDTKPTPPPPPPLFPLSLPPLIRNQRMKVSEKKALEKSVGEFLLHNSSCLELENRLTVAPETRIDHHSLVWHKSVSPSVDFINFLFALKPKFLGKSYIRRVTIFGADPHNCGPGLTHGLVVTQSPNFVSIIADQSKVIVRADFPSSVPLITLNQSHGLERFNWSCSHALQQYRGDVNNYGILDGDWVLKLMIPCVVFSGPVGLGFGAEGDSFVACISPALSSVLIITMCVAYVSIRGTTTSYVDGALFGGILIACGASLGAFVQWLIQVIMHEKRGHKSILFSWLNILKDNDVREFFTLILPATFISGMAQISSFTDLYFASFIPSAAAGLSYAYLISMAPLGLLSSIIILPLLPTFSELAKPRTWPILMKNLKQAVMLCMWSVFDPTASDLVSSSLICYAIGSPFYIVRELLVMVFYALGDGKQPFLISMGAIALNAFLDWLFVSRFCLGARGLSPNEVTFTVKALSTSLVTSLSALALFSLLSRKLTVLQAGISLRRKKPGCIISGNKLTHVKQDLSAILPHLCKSKLVTNNKKCGGNCRLLSPQSPMDQILLNPVCRLFGIQFIHSLGYSYLVLSNCNQSVMHLLESLIKWDSYTINIYHEGERFQLRKKKIRRRAESRWAPQ
ncbi:hypothetical protein IFM89_003089 [Coptis chinensis]|uniref:Uncharacterized protein n=1 Tax=Coptis chinensis TaxID=261450 RepID=A0A835I9H1_9MAGN|nr:hypothetical protein IFM89_003089 [Coptis chinensis]